MKNRVFLKSDHSWYTGRTLSSGPKIKVPCTFEHFPYRATDFYPVKSRVVEVLQYFAILYRTTQCTVKRMRNEFADLFFKIKNINLKHSKFGQVG